MHTPAQLARHLIDAYAEHVRFVASPGEGPADLAQAYAVQGLVWREMVGKTRPHVWKVGAASTSAQPMAAPIFPIRYSVSPGRFKRRGLCSLGVEAEIAVRFGRNLPARNEPYGREEILAAIGGVHVAMEVVDSRLQDPDYAGANWCLADNLLNGALILGDEIAHWRELTWRDLTVRVMADDRVLDERVANPPLGDLFHCLPWWIDHAGGAKDGDVVTTGAWTGMHRVGQARELGVAFAGLGECRATG